MTIHWPLLSRRSRTAQLAPGTRIYAIGDIHGEAVLFKQLLDRIEADSQDRGPAEVRIILLGDFIDRGPAAAGLLLALAGCADPRLTILKGNHEASMVAAWRGDHQALALWLRFGGTPTLIGLGAQAEELERIDPAALLATLRRCVAPAMIDWLDALPSAIEIDDYFFTHAGIRPGVPLDEQVEDDLLWIRRPFLTSRRQHAKVIVHGHTIDQNVRLGSNRIGVDTGAFRYGRLTALGLQDDRQWTLEASDDRDIR
ncbi:MAG TPA: metallophosphoesterase [Sphingomonas sp.]|jgi:serine/threonine protein phosphatase 1|nr:metallophosphoesterase [Sphingomonas sp.]